MDYTSLACAPPVPNFTHIVCLCHIHFSAAPISCISPLHISFSHLASTSRLHLSFASTICSSQSPSHLQLSFTPLNCTCCLHLSFAHLIGTSSFHIMLTPLLCTHVRILLTLLACISHVHLQFASLLLRFRLTSHMQRSLATLSATPCFNLWFAPLVHNLHWHLSCAPLSFASYMQLSVAPLSWAFRKHSKFITSHISFAILGCPLSGASPLHWSSVPLICISSAPLHLTSHVQLAFAPHILLIASLIAPLTCTSDLHLLEHLSIAYLSCTYHVRHAVSHLGYKSQLHFSVSSLLWT